MQLTLAQEKLLRDLTRVFLEENQKLNLSAFRTEEDCWIGNVLDSISGITEEDFPTGARVIDVGTGGGFPLLPLALLFPSVHFTGLDATRKKIDAVRRILKTMKLKNVTLVCGRAEELGHDENLREKFDVVLGRAVASLSVLLEYLSPFARPPLPVGQTKFGGKIICWKSLSIDDELQQSLSARMMLKCRLITKRLYELPGGAGRRQLLLFEKTDKLATQFPRAVGVVKKKPL